MSKPALLIGLDGALRLGPLGGAVMITVPVLEAWPGVDPKDLAAYHPPKHRVYHRTVEVSHYIIYEEMPGGRPSLGQTEGVAWPSRRSS